MKKILVGIFIILSVTLVLSLETIYTEEEGTITDQYLEISKQDLRKIDQINKAVDRTIKKDRINDYLFRLCDRENFDEDIMCDDEVIEIKRIVGETELFIRNNKTYLKLEFEVKTRNNPEGYRLMYLVINFNDYSEIYILEDISNLEEIPYRE